MEIRDNRGGDWLWMHNEIVDRFGSRLSTNALWCYVVLCRFANNTEQSAFPTLARIGWLMGKKSEKTVRRALAELEDAGLIAIEARFTDMGHQTSNRYTLLALPALDSPPPAPGRGDKNDRGEGVTHDGGRGSPMTGEQDSREQDSLIQVQDASGKPAASGAAKKPRKRNPVFDAVALHFFDLPPEADIPTGARQQIGRFCAALRDITPPVAEEEIATWAASYPAAGLTRLQDPRKAAAALLRHRSEQSALVEEDEFATASSWQIAT